jgi:3-deoxy-D-manno-octulosonate 8-phosphate phosphatase (KDO 8-P phosphatase)
MSVSEAEWAGVKLFVCDVDGVLTDGTVLYGPDGELAKPFYIRDGMGLRLLEAADVRVAVVTSEDSAVVRGRVSRLLLSAYLPGMKRKGDAVRELMRRFGVTAAQTVYIGDDVNDAEAMAAAGIPCAPCDASDFARMRARHVTRAAGGRGAVREVAEQILAARNLDLDALWRGLYPNPEVHDAGGV